MHPHAYLAKRLPTFSELIASLEDGLEDVVMSSLKRRRIEHLIVSYALVITTHHIPQGPAPAWSEVLVILDLIESL